MDSISELLEMNDEVFLAVVDKKLGAFIAEIQPSDYWVGGDEGGFTDNSNIFFQTPQEAESYYNRTYKEVYAFDNEDEAEEKCNELEKIYG